MLKGQQISMSNIVPPLVGLGLLAFGLVLILFPNVPGDPYGQRKFGFAKGTNLVFGAVALIMGVAQLVVWYHRHR